MPLLVEDGQSIFPTAIIAERLAERSGQTLGDRQLLAALLSWTDTLVTVFYQKWAGLTAGGQNTLGFDPSERHLQRAGPFLDWVAARVSSTEPGAAEFALGCIILWTDSRGPIVWQGRPAIDALISDLRSRPSFRETELRPLRPAS